ncbi:hypothetical protein HID58_003685, partial [Brassica napus]
ALDLRMMALGPDQSDSPPDHDRVLRSDEDRVCNRCDLWCGLSWLLNRIYGSFEKPSEKEKGYVFPRADGENGENCHVRRLGRRASSAGILQRPNTDKNWYVALELQAFLDMAKDEGASRNFVMITSKTCVQIPESALLKERILKKWNRFKMFNMQFDELHQRQSQWTLRESLRLAVAEVLLPAYRSFLKRFGFELKPDLCQKVSSFELDDSLVHCVLPRFEVADGEVQRECGKGVTSSKALCGHMACHFEREKRVKKSVKSSVISHGLV